MFTNVIGVDQAADGLQGAECVILTVVLPGAGIPDQIAVLLIRQNVRRRALKQ